MSEKPAEEKKEDEEDKTGESDEEEEEEVEEEEDDDDDEEDDDVDEDMFDRETGEAYGDTEQSWSIVHFNDKKHMKYYKYASDRTAKDIKELAKTRVWKCNIRSVKYCHEWTASDQNDIFLKFYVGCNQVIRKIKVRTPEKDPQTGKRMRKKIWKIVGHEGKLLVTDLFNNLQPFEEREYNGFEHNLTLNLSYFELFDQKIRVEVFDYHSLMPNERMGFVERPMVNIARDVLNQVWRCTRTNIVKKRKEVQNIGTIKFVCVLQEVLKFELQLQNWSGSVNTGMMAINDASAKDKDQSRIVYMRYKLGGGFFRNFLPGGFTKKKMFSKDTGVQYQFDDVQAHPQFRTMGKMKFVGTRTELESEIMQVKVFHKTGSATFLIGKGHTTLEGCAIGAALSTDIAWGIKHQKNDPLPAGRVNGSMDVNCPTAPLWREYSQVGEARPMELKVYKPFEYCYLCIRIVRARDLCGINDNGTSDPYVTCEWADVCRQTAVHYDTCDPEFDETLYFRIKARLNDMPKRDEFASCPFVTLNVWDYDPAGNSDNLGTARLYLHNITGPRPYKPFSKDDPQKYPHWKPSVPKKRIVKFRARRHGPLREHAILTRSHTQVTKLDGLPAHLESLLTVEAWFHGPGLIGEDKKAKGTSSHAKRKDDDGSMTSIMRSGDLVQLAERPRNELGEAVGARIPAGLFYLDYYEHQEGKLETEEETSQVEFFYKRLAMSQYGRRFTKFDKKHELVRGLNQYGQCAILPKFLTPIVPPYEMVDPKERERMICLDAKKPITCQKIAYYIKNIEFEFIDEEIEHIGTAQPGSWCSPNFFLKARKGDVQAHVLLQAGLLLGLKVDAWVCLGIAKISDVLSGKREGLHYWVLTRESTSRDCTEFYDDPEVKDKGAIKFWEPSMGKNIVPLLPNRWEGRDDELAYRLAIGKGARAVAKKKAKEQVDDGLKLRRRRKQSAKDENSDEEGLPEEEDMLVFMKSKSHTKRTDEVIKSDGIFVHGAGLEGETWGKADERSLLMNAAQVFEQKRQETSEKQTRAAMALAAARRAEKAPEYHERLDWIRENDDYKEVVEAGKYPYVEVHGVFNHRQMFANVQDSVDPTKIGYDFQLDIRGGWIGVINDHPFEMPMKIKVEPWFPPVSLGAKMSDEMVSQIEGIITENLEAAITNFRHSINLETNWSANENVRPLLIKTLESKFMNACIPKVYSTGWNQNYKDYKGNEAPAWDVDQCPREELNDCSMGFYWWKMHKRNMRHLFQSVPPGYQGRLNLFECANVDPIAIRSRILSHKYTEVSPWQRSYNGKEMFALAVQVCPWPNATCSALIGLMTIHPKEDGKND